MRRKAYEYGIDAENSVRAHLKNLNYEFIGSRIKTPYGELDLIFKKDKLLIFIEVKARNFLEHTEVITATQIKRIWNAASYYISINEQFQNYDIRFDLIIVRGKEVYEHIENAFYT